MAQTAKLTALYARFSYDDGADTESDSIEHQKAMLRDFALQNGFENIAFYCDDGYTGTNFNRPDFQRMMADIKKGIIGAVIVKDMSRLGRNYILVGQITEIEFPRYKVRFIAIGDNVDSAKGMSELMPVQNLINEWYSKDISKKIKSMIHQKGNSGQSISTRLPFGYIRHPEDKKLWIIDEKAAEIIQEIFELYVYECMGTHDIAKHLEREKRYSVEYHFLKNKGAKIELENPFKWYSTTIHTILSRREYVGDTVNFRSEVTSYKNKTIIRNGEDKIKIFLDTHPPIITRELFALAQDRKEKTIRHRAKSHKYLFGDFLFCMDCKARMYGKRSNDNKSNPIYCYECNNYRKNGTCCFHGAPEDYLTTEVLKIIQKMLENYKLDKHSFISFARHKVADKLDSKNSASQAELDEARNRLSEIDQYIQGLFESKVRGEIDGTLFASFRKTYEDEKSELNLKIAKLIDRLGDQNQEQNKLKILLDALEKYDAVDELTTEILADFVEHIEVGQIQGNTKKVPIKCRNNVISVFFWGIGSI